MLFILLSLTLNIIQKYTFENVDMICKELMGEFDYYTKTKATEGEANRSRRRAGEQLGITLVGR